VFQEVVLGIKVVKAYGWESSFLEKVMAIRKKESTAQLSLAYLQAIVFPISIAMPIAAITATFAVRVAVEGACRRQAKSTQPALCLRYCAGVAAVWHVLCAAKSWKSVVLVCLQRVGTLHTVRALSFLGMRRYFAGRWQELHGTRLLSSHGALRLCV
jgi:hypothetical protein